MRGGLIISVAFHAALLLALLIGLPFFDTAPKSSPPPIPVEIVRLSDATSAPKGAKPQPKSDKQPDADKTTAKEPARRDPKAGDKGKDAKTAKAETKPEPKKPAEKPKPEPKPAPKAEPKPPAPKTEAKTKPAPKPEPKAEPERVEVAPKPRTPEKTPEKKQIAEANPPKPKAEKPREEKTEPEEERTRVATRPRVRPKTPRRVAREPEPVKKKPETKKPEKRVATKKRGDVKSMDSVFKTVNELKQKTRDTDKTEQTARPKPVGRETAKKSAPLTISEIDAIRQQIQPCWYFPAGARNPERLRVAIRLRLRPDGSLISAEVKDRARMASDSYYRAAAEAALRAVRNPQCSPLRLPPAKYDQWKALTVEFDPAKLGAG